MDSNQILSANEDFALVGHLQDLTEAIAKWGYPCRAATQDSLRKLSQLPEERKQMILSSLQTTLEIVQAGSQKNEESSDLSREHPEKAMVERALDFYGLEICDDFWRTVDREDLIEIYNEDHVQIFRTLNFFKLSSYSLLDLLVNEWFVLWERPRSVVEKMFEVARKCMGGEITGVQPLGIPRHVLREIYHPAIENGPTLTRSSLVEFKMICPVYKKGLPVITGLIVNTFAKTLATGEEALKIDFL